MSSKRPPELRFDEKELLFRRVAQYNLKDGRLKPTALNLQISVSRSSVESAEQVRHSALQGPYPAFNGVASIQVAAARLQQGHVRTACIDEPTSSIPAHALIALWTEASPAVDIEEDIELARTALARAFKIAIPPDSTPRSAIPSR